MVELPKERELFTLLVAREYYSYLVLMQAAPVLSPVKETYSSIDLVTTVQDYPLHQPTSVNCLLTCMRSRTKSFILQIEDKNVAKEKNI